MEFKSDPTGKATRGGGFYVSVVQGTRYGLLAGPFQTHAEAKALVPRVRALAERLAPRDSFGSAFGTSRVKGEPFPEGLLNGFLSEELAA